MVFKNLLARKETFAKDSNGQYDVDTSYAAYEGYIEESRDKEGKVITSKDGNPRYHAIDESKMIKLTQDTIVKTIREGFYKVVFTVNGDYVELVERDNQKRIYFTIDPKSITTLKAGTMVICGNNNTYRIPTEKGLIVVDEKNIENPKVVFVKKFQSEDHKAEAEKAVARNYRKGN